jgi:hypothetical protein
MDGDLPKAMFDDLDERLRVVEMLVGAPMSDADRIIAQTILDRRRRALMSGPEALDPARPSIPLG